MANLKKYGENMCKKKSSKYRRMEAVLLAFLLATPVGCARTYRMYKGSQLPASKVAIINGRYDYIAGNNITIVGVGFKILAIQHGRLTKRRYHSVIVLPGRYVITASAKFPILFSTGYRYFIQRLYVYAKAGHVYQIFAKKVGNSKGKMWIKDITVPAK